MTRAEHWENIYAARADAELSWFEAEPAQSLALVTEAISNGARSVIDVGGGTSLLVDRLLGAGLDRLAVLDISETALARSRDRLGRDADRVTWIAGDVTKLEEVGTYDVWHDRAVFHFLTAAPDRAGYVSLAARTVPVGGYAVLATFGLGGPSRCSGLEIERYDAPKLSTELGPAFLLVRSATRTHVTPAGASQEFLYAMYRRVRLPSADPVNRT